MTLLVRLLAAFAVWRLRDWQRLHFNGWGFGFTADKDQPDRPKA